MKIKISDPPVIITSPTTNFPTKITYEGKAKDVLEVKRDIKENRGYAGHLIANVERAFPLDIAIACQWLPVESMEDVPPFPVLPPGAIS